jgi:hypothetical protein
VAVDGLLAISNDVVSVAAAANDDSGALADDTHSVTVTGNNAGANFVLLHVKHIAVWLPSVGDGVDGAGEGG